MDSPESEETIKYAKRYAWLRTNGCILIPRGPSGDELPTARMLEALDERLDELIAKAAVSQ